MKIDSYSNIILTIDELFQQVQDGEFQNHVELAKYNIYVKLIDIQLKAIERQILLDTENVDETKLTEFVVKFTNNTVDNEVKITENTKTSRVNSKKKSSSDCK